MNLITSPNVSLARCPPQFKHKVCELGFAAKAGSSFCLQCPAGSFATTEASNYTYGVGIEATVCQPCPSGSHIEYPGSIFCAACEAGTYSTRGQNNCTRCGLSFKLPSPCLGDYEYSHFRFPISHPHIPTRIPHRHQLRPWEVIGERRRKLHRMRKWKSGERFPNGGLRIMRRWHVLKRRAHKMLELSARNLLGKRCWRV